MHPDDRSRGVERWPGVTFDMNINAAKVLLGSPNGQAAGYFLAQHKHRFGRSKTISKVQVFRPDKGMMPYLLFSVVDAPPVALTGKEQAEQMVKVVAWAARSHLNLTYQSAV
ncbi:hypothetical protein BKA63DRAFT_242013 [Paraphoma chrysanthemicola]|nr:hypothetical protein BKA63DRAFT_242013 [Paraphoma chrysanthemicola]